MNKQYQVTIILIMFSWSVGYLFEFLIPYLCGALIGGGIIHMLLLWAKEYDEKEKENSN